MNDSPHPTEESLYEQAMERTSPAEREAFLIKACGEDATLLAKVRELLACDAEAADQHFLPTVMTGGDRPGVAAPQSEQPGATIGPYKLREQIGEGGFGTVWVADQEQPVRRRVALKIIKLGMDTKEVIARFGQERQALAMMDHPNIAKVLDAGTTENGRPYFVMELVRGVKITEFCDDQHLPMTERIELFITVCHAVQHAHQKGIIHRDLKPSNILVTVNDGKAVPKVIDFGVAKATQGRLTDQTVYTQFQQMIGTPLYMSPEQAELTSLDIDTRSDIYALGVLLYELLTGHTPIEQDTLARVGMDEIRRLIREVDPPLPSLRVKTFDGAELTTAAKRRHTDPAKLPATLRGDLDWIVMKCIEKDRNRRYDTANGLALDLHRHLANEVVVARPPTAGYLLGKLIRRNRLAFSAGTAIAASLVIGITVSVWQAVRAERAGARAETEAAKANAALADLRSMAPALSAQARALVMAGRMDEAVEKLDYALKLTPDSRELLFARADLLESQLKLGEAATAYRAVLRLAPDDPRATRNAALCEKLSLTQERGQLPRESLALLYQAMIEEQRPAPEVLSLARLLGQEKAVLLEYWRTRLSDVATTAERPISQRLEMREDSLLRLDLSGTKIADLSPFIGMPLGALILTGCNRVTDITPLRGLPLKDLDLAGTAVVELMPLQSLESLVRLRLSDCPIVDLAPLRGLRLRELRLSNLPASDLSPLRGMPLRMLVLWQSPNLRGFKMLADLPALECLVLPWAVDATPPDELEAIDALRNHPGLRQIGADSPSADALVSTTIPGRDEFFREWDHATGWRLSLQRQGAEIKVERLDGGQSRIEIKGAQVHDLSALQGLRQIGGRALKEVIVSRTDVADLSPLTGLPLRRLEAEYTKVADLSPLQGMPLELIRMTDSPVVSVAPLAGMKSLADLAIGGTSVTDLAPLAGLPITLLQANRLQVPSLEPLRGMPLRQLFLFEAGDMDLSPLADCPIEHLHLGGAKVTNFKPLSACTRLRHLWLSDTKIEDVSPLAGLPLIELHLGSSRVRDIKPLIGMPLRIMSIDNCPVEDLAPLLEITTLEQLVASQDARGVEALRSHPRIAFLATRWDLRLSRPATTATDFWADWDNRRP